MQRKKDSLKESLNKLLEGQAEIKISLENIQVEIADIKLDMRSYKTETAEKFNDHDKKITELQTKITEFEKRENAQKEAHRKSEILNELYSKRLNLLICGIPDPGAWESRDNSLQHIKYILKDGLQIEDSGSIGIVDCHRLPQNLALNEEG